MDKGTSSDSAVFKYVLSCVAATVAETATYPLDLTKTRLQIQGELQVAHAAGLPVGSRGGATTPPKTTVTRGMLRTAVGIVKEEGILKLWQGVTPAVLRHYVYTGVRVGVYEKIRENIFSYSHTSQLSLWQAILSGAVGGAVAQFIASPTDLVKVQMQMEGRRRLEGLPPRVKNMWHAVRKATKHSGYLGLWKGWVPNCQRAALVNMADLATYDKVKHTILAHTTLRDNYVTHGLSSICSGLAAAIASTPADVIKTRVMNQPLDKQGKGLHYSSSLDCLVKTIRQEGVFALYKGFVPIWARMAPWSLTFWISYEKIRRITGASSF